MNTMSAAIPEPLLSGLSDFLARRTGIHFPRERWSDLDRGIKAATRELGLGDAQACVQRFLSAPPTKAELEILVSHFTVGETYFFREPRTFEIIETRVLPDLIRSRRGGNRSLRIWSAGCATGEEPYSIAILLHKLIPDPDDWNITILATDINPRFLRKAANGVYNEWSFRNVPSWIREKYFEAVGQDRRRILPEIRRMVNFSYLNLVEDVYPALLNGTNAMDLIFCRNVLMYFRPQSAQRVIEGLHHSLVEGGWLVVSPVETSHVLFSAYTSVGFGGVTLYAKPRMFARSMADFEPAPESLLPKLELPKLEVGPPGAVAPEPETAIAHGATAVPQPPTMAQPPAAPPSEAGWYDETLMLHRNGHDAEAARRAAERLAGNADDVRAMELMARMLADQGRLAEAAEWCERIVAHDRLDAGHHYLRAMIDQERGRFTEAVASLKRVLYLDPDFVLAHFALGNMARAQGGRRESGRHFGNALALLGALGPEEILPHSEGLTAGRLKEIIQSTTFRETAA